METFAINSTEQYLLMAAGILLAVQIIYYLVLYSCIGRRNRKEQRTELHFTQELPPLSVIICAHDEVENLRRNLPAILAQDYPDFEVIVINDGEKNESEDYLLQLEEQYRNLYHSFVPDSSRYISRKKLAVTLGIRASRHDWLVLTEANCQPQSNQWLRLMARNFTPHTGVVLGYSGLLDGKRAATHWYDSEIFHSQFPSVQLDKDVLYVEDDGLTTSAGIAAGIDCCLHVLRILEGAKVANSVARLMVSPPFREGGQRQFIEQPVPMHSIDQRISKAIKELSESLNKTVDFRSVAHAAAMSERSFYRVFVKTTGMTPYRWLLCARLRRAQELLEGSDFSVESVAIHCGFESVITFRKRFKEQFGISPSAWRKTFCSDS